MKAYPKHIDWGKVIATNNIMDGYVMPKYGKKNLFEDDSWIDIILDDVYDTFYRDEEEAAKTDESWLGSWWINYGEIKWKSKDEIAYVILEDLWLKYEKDDKGKGKLVEDNGKGKEAEHHHLKVNKDDKRKGKLVEDNGKGKVHDIQNRVGFVKVDLARAIKAKQVDDHDLENRIKKLEKDFGRLLKAKKAKESKKAKKAKEAKKAREAELTKQAKKAREAKLKAKEANEEELKAKKAKEAKEVMLA
ncbi:hypothetical protein Tco_0549223 [Tanacetum coccineum]